MILSEQGIVDTHIHLWHRRLAERAWLTPDLWQAKIARTKMRDRRQTKVAKDLGWTVLRFWECDVSGDALHVADEIARLVHARSNR